MSILSRLFCGIESRACKHCPDIDLRAMWPGDEEAVMQIEAASFPVADQWTVEDFYGIFDPASPALGHIAQAAGRIVGFCVSRILDEHTLMIDNLAVHPVFRRLKVASRLLADLAGRQMIAWPKRFRAVVRETNLDAQLFFRATGWRAIGMLRRPWDGIEEDGIRFFKRVISH